MAAGVNCLPANDLERFAAAFFDYFSSANAPVDHLADSLNASPPP
jgi:hypothetical protein